ncbi:alpha/beta hydrolase [Candidatus Tisiphia endosymbiont of Nemotelus uliginosus]|uniref:alpha/beta hydrolase n=1 Tax=Candidatus Tisiphia endosymbiont of Nemotelus uliginosus TaxID=3077926 RepID=UPI0035C9318F
MGSWLEGVEMVLNSLVEHPAIIIGSSMGAWLALLAARNFPQKVKAVICLAAAVDFTEELIWQKLPEMHKKQMEQQQWLDLTGSCSNNVFPISYRLIVEARKYLLLNSHNINLKMPVHLIHGMEDEEVPYVFSQQIMDKIISKTVLMKLIKDGNHQLSRDADLAVIANSIEEVLTAC